MVGWSKKYKSSIDCDNPKGFSQKAHCAGKEKKMAEGRVNDDVKRLQKDLETLQKQVRPVTLPDLSNLA